MIGLRETFRNTVPVGTNAQYDGRFPCFSLSFVSLRYFCLSRNLALSNADWIGLGWTGVGLG